MRVLGNTAKIPFSPSSKIAVGAASPPPPADNPYTAPPAPSPPSATLPARVSALHDQTPPEASSPLAKASPMSVQALTAQTSPPAAASPLLAPAPRPLVPIPANSEGRFRESQASRPEQQQARMRSQIACAHCRRSKVKCVNNGINTVCNHCRQAGRECTYPVSTTNLRSTLSARRESIAQQAIGEAPKKRQKKAAAPDPATPYPFKEGPLEKVDALDSPWLGPNVWIELYHIYQKHFATDLPFLHDRTFLKPLQKSTLHSPPADSFMAQSQSPSSTQPPGSPPLLLAFLALTAPFHPALVQHFSSPMAASEHYAAAARALLNQHGDAPSRPTLERVQARLMLGIQEWGMLKGGQSWETIGVAIRNAQALGLQYEPDLDDMPEACLDPHGRSPNRNEKLSKEDAFIEQEIKRRTFWSCFILDRYVSSGKHRPQMLYVQDFRIQLPCSERAFNFGHRVKTLMLSDPIDRDPVREDSQGRSVNGVDDDSHEMREVDDDVKWEIGPTEGPLARFIRVLDLYGSILKWACTGGRRREKHAPWKPQSKFYQFEKELDCLKQHLSADLTLTRTNTEAHISGRTSRNYVLIHAVYSLCTIALHREYLAFFPFMLTKPEGPKDVPKFNPEEIGSKYWEDRARECFKTAREFIDLLHTCQEWDVLVETPISGFAAYHVVVCALYCAHFPQMDQSKYLTRSPRRHGHKSGSGGLDALSKSWQIVFHMHERLKMAQTWVRTIARLKACFEQKRKEFKSKGPSPPASDGKSAGEQLLPFVEGGYGLHEYLELEKDLKELGYSPQQEGEDVVMMDVDRDLFASSQSKDGENGSESGSSPSVKVEIADTTEGTPDSTSMPREKWNAINSATAISERGLPNLSNGHKSSYVPQVPSHVAQSNSTPLQEGHHSYRHPSTNDQHHTYKQPSTPTSTDSVQRASQNLYQIQNQAMGDASVPSTPQQPVDFSEDTKATYAHAVEVITFDANDFSGFARGSPMNPTEQYATVYASQPYSWWPHVYPEAI